MTVRYVGPGGNDVSDGLSWANRRLTLNGCEDSPVAAGDICYIAPGVYRELLTCDVSGSSGLPITYVADVTGEHTDGVGGIVRITGSDNDQSATRANCITATNIDYRTFRGFMFDTVTGDLITATNCDNWIVEDCDFQYPNSDCIFINTTSLNWTIRRCRFMFGLGNGIYIWNSAAHAGNHTIENCVCVGGGNYFLRCDSVATITFRNNVVAHCGYGIVVFSPVTGTVNANNCTFTGISSSALYSDVAGQVVENYNTLYANNTNRTNVSVGANSVTYPPLFAPSFLLAGYGLPQLVFGELSQWSQIRAIAGSGEATDDLFGLTRPTTSAKKSWGAVQFQDMNRETGTVNAGLVALKLADAGEVQFIVPVTAVSTTITVKCYREADYTGTNPRMVIKQPGQSDRTTTDAGAASAWNTLTDTFTPDAGTDFVVVVLQSLNTAAATNYDVFFDTGTVSPAKDTGSMEFWLTARMPFTVLPGYNTGSGGAVNIFGESLVR